MATEKTSDNVRAVDRALDILMAFTATDYELTAGQLLKRVDLSRPTLYRLLYTLEQSGFLVSSGEPQKFRLGPAVAHLSHVWTSSLDLNEMAKPMLRRLWEKTGETVALFIPQGAYRSCISELPCTQPLSFKRGVGYRERIVLGASGRAILAYMDITPELLKEYAAGTKLDPKKYAEDLQSTRERGYAISNQEIIQGAVSIAAPFFNSGGQVAGSVGIFGPSARLDAGQVKELGELLVEETTLFSEALGLRGK